MKKIAYIISFGVVFYLLFVGFKSLKSFANVPYHDSPPAHDTKGEVTFIDVFNLDEQLSLRNLSMEEIRKKFSISEKNIEYNVKYEKLVTLTKLHNKNYHPGHFYFRNGKLVMLYIGENEELKEISSKLLQSNFAEEGIKLRSRAGKTFNHYVYPDKGVAFSADSKSVRFIEIFPPTSLEAYKAEIYEEPQPFIK